MEIPQLSTQIIGTCKYIHNNLKPEEVILIYNFTSVTYSSNIILFDSMCWILFKWFDLIILGTCKKKKLSDYNFKL